MYNKYGNRSSNNNNGMHQEESRAPNAFQNSNDSKSNKFIVKNNEQNYPVQNMTPQRASGLDRDDIFKIIGLGLAIFGPVIGVYFTLHDNSLEHGFKLREQERRIEMLIDSNKTQVIMINELNARIRIIESKN